ncbi:unnamed protein product [Cylicocyclus nassatus]|uniref:C6 domain-containing protein n=1 Tax=Cylicocyclus nassatus TaxID=53992 RepID=A0AA36DKE2_CYLNA|nr:unnamed protein product [Cylicocyclus nassatus]
MRLMILLLFTFVNLVASIPSKGCMLCSNVLIERHPNEARVELEKVVDGTGCFVQNLKCLGNDIKSETFVQFNHGRTGFLAHGAQELQLQCSDEGRWRFEHSELGSIAVESVSCLST